MLRNNKAYNYILTPWFFLFFFFPEERLNIMCLYFPLSLRYLEAQGIQNGTTWEGVGTIYLTSTTHTPVSSCSWFYKSSRHRASIMSPTSERQEEFICQKKICPDCRMVTAQRLERSQQGSWLRKQPWRRPQAAAPLFLPGPSPPSASFSLF